jgi:hypothetical protein
VGIREGVADEGNACEEVLAGVNSATRFHLESPGPEARDVDAPVPEAFGVEAMTCLIDKCSVEAPPGRRRRSLPVGTGHRDVREGSHVAGQRRTVDEPVTGGWPSCPLGNPPTLPLLPLDTRLRCTGYSGTN